MSLISPETPLSALTVNDLKAIIREIIREEMQREYYVNQDGIRILYQAEDIEPNYGRGLQADYNAYCRGRLDVVAGKTILAELQAKGEKP